MSPPLRLMCTSGLDQKVEKFFDRHPTYLTFVTTTYGESVGYLLFLSYYNHIRDFLQSCLTSLEADFFTAIIFLDPDAFLAEPSRY